MRIIIIAIFFCLFFFYGSVLTADNRFVVVIDPGHGGTDGGATRGKYKEKDMTLAVGLLLGKTIEANHPDVKVVYTRKTDATLILHDRAHTANRAKGNLFISIHVNSSEKKMTAAGGVETYMLGLSKSAENLAVAKRENSVILLEDNYKSRYEGFDPNSPESNIIFEFMTNKYMDQSLDLASHIQYGLRNIALRPDRGVRQAGFLVLRAVSMPSVLVEMGFVNNPTEADYLSSKAGQKMMAEAIYEGFRKYKLNFDKRQGGGTNLAFEENQHDSEKLPLDGGNENLSVSYLHNLGIVDTPKEDLSGEISTAVENSFAKPEVLMPKEPEQNIATVDVAVDNPIEAPLSLKKDYGDEIEYRVQFYISLNHYPQESSIFRGLSPIDYYEDEGYYKYTYGSTADLNEIVNELRRVRVKFKDAFVVKFRKGKRAQ